MSDSRKKARALARALVRKAADYVPPDVKSVKVPLPSAQLSPACGPSTCPPSSCAPPGPCGPGR